MRGFILLLLLFPAVCRGEDTIRINNLGLDADSHINSVPFVLKALEMTKGRGKCVIVFEKGRYDFWPQHSIEKDFFESNTTYVPFRRCAFLIEDTNELEIDCGGSTFIFHDKFQPFTIANSSDITIRNVSVDWEIPFGAEAEIAEVTDTYFDLKIDGCKYPFIIENEKLFFTGEGWKNLWGGVKWNDPIEFDRETLEVTAETDDDLLGSGWEQKYTATILENGIVRIHYNNNKLLKKGNYLVLRHGVRDHSGVFITDSRNICLENINMHSNSGMSFLAQYSEDLFFKNLRCIPGPGRLIMSGHDDGLHFSNCRGQITVDSCVLKGLMDDGLNVHGTYVVIEKRINDTTLLCRFPHHQSIGLEWARKGEGIGFVDGLDMQDLGDGVVTKVQAVSTELFEVTVRENIPDPVSEGDALQNNSWEPDVLISNSYFGHHRARGALISTGGKIIVKNNVFETSGSAIVIPGDITSYFESSPVKDLTIESNVFKASCLTSYYMASDAIIVVTLDRPVSKEQCIPIHKNIKVMNNTFEVFDYPVFYVMAAEGISFNGNHIKYSNKHTARHQNKSSLTFAGCRKIEVKGNTIENNVPGKNIRLLNTDRKELSLAKNQDLRLN